PLQGGLGCLPVILGRGVSTQPRDAKSTRRQQAEHRQKAPQLPPHAGERRAQSAERSSKRSALCALHSATITAAKGCHILAVPKSPCSSVRIGPGCHSAAGSPHTFRVRGAVSRVRACLLCW